MFYRLWGKLYHTYKVISPAVYFIMGRSGALSVKGWYFSRIIHIKYNGGISIELFEDFYLFFISVNIADNVRVCWMCNLK